MEKEAIVKEDTKKDLIMEVITMEDIIDTS